MRIENQSKDDELIQLREGIKRAMQASNTTNSQAASSSSSSSTNHFSSILESQSIELCKLRRLLEEHQRRERTCQRKWNALLRENLNLQQKINGDAQ